MFRYRLRTLLILLAVGPPLLAGVIVEPWAVAVFLFTASAMALSLGLAYVVAFIFSPENRATSINGFSCVRAKPLHEDFCAIAVAEERKGDASN